MAESLYVTGLGVATETFNPQTPVIAKIPGFEKTSATYACQVVPGQSVLFRLSPEIFGSFIRAELAQDQLNPKLEELLATKASRALPFLQYLQNKSVSPEFTPVKERLCTGPVKSNDLDVLAAEVSVALGGRRTAKASSYDPLPDYIKSYLETGVIDEATLSIFAEKIHPLFAEISSYVLAKAKASGTPAKREHLPKKIDAVAKSVPPFFAPVEFAVEYPGRKNGILAPINYEFHNGADSQPDDNFIPVQKLARFVTVSDVALGGLIAPCLASEKALAGVNIPYGLVMRAILPNNPAVLALYPDERVSLKGKPDMTELVKAKAMEYFQNGTMARAAAKHYSLPESEISPQTLGDLVDAHSRVMQCLPRGIFGVIAMEFRYDRLLENESELNQQTDELYARKQSVRTSVQLKEFEVSKNYLFAKRGALMKNIKLLAREHDQLVDKLKSDFGVETRTMATVDIATLEEAIQFFGSKFEFLRKVFLAESIEPVTAS